MLQFDDFKTQFNSIVQKRALTWEVIGFYDKRKLIYPFGTDTKVISTVFESIASPIIHEIADYFGYRVETTTQTKYPDFTLIHKTNRNLYEPNKYPHIAIDIKSTYRENSRLLKFTLGSYNSFLRNDHKSIHYPYHLYNEHWVIGFVYDRNQAEYGQYYHIDSVDQIPLPYANVEYFIQGKYKIAGLTPGSGNTKNIGSFSSTIQGFRDGIGPFSRYGSRGKVYCDEYWKYYPQFKNLEDLESFLKEQYPDFNSY